MWAEWYGLNTVTATGYHWLIYNTYGSLEYYMLVYWSTVHWHNRHLQIGRSHKFFRMFVFHYHMWHCILWSQSIRQFRLNNSLKLDTIMAESRILTTCLSIAGLCINLLISWTSNISKVAVFTCSLACFCSTTTSRTAFGVVSALNNFSWIILR